MTDRLRPLVRGIKAFLGNSKPAPAEFDLGRHCRKRLRNEFYAPRVGHAAPEFNLEQLAADGSRSGKVISLKEFNGQNLALLFGYYTCPSFRRHIVRLNEIHTELQGQLPFLLIYMRDVHTADGWQKSINEEQGIVYNQPRTIDERASIGLAFINRHNVRMPVALDDTDDSISTHYAGSPERLYLINGDGIIEHQSEPGPFDMPVVENWYEALKKACLA